MDLSALHFDVSAAISGFAADPTLGENGQKSDIFCDISNVKIASQSW
jgi:hypothetical protein